MREIKFRIWDKSQDRMIYSNDNNDDYAIQGKREWLPFRFDIGFSHYDIDDFSEMMLFTGLQDKNGKDIYEGDVVKVDCVYEYNKLFDGVMIVKYGISYFEFVYDSNYFKECKEAVYLTTNQMNSYNLEVIGNIHDNPELITTENCDG